MRRVVIGVMGAGDAAGAEDVATALELGQRIAGEGWVLLTGGRACGVMEAASRGAKQVPGSLTVGILPGAGDGESEAVDLVIATGMGAARNNINVLSSDVVIAVGATGSGTASEVALALKAGKHVVLLNPSPEARAFFESIGRGQVTTVYSADAAVNAARTRLGSEGVQG